LKEAIGETRRWLDESAKASKEEYAKEQKKLEAIADSIMQ
jgi:hypothetical protein